MQSYINKYRERNPSLVGQQEYGQNYVILLAFMYHI